VVWKYCNFNNVFALGQIIPNTPAVIMLSSKIIIEPNDVQLLTGKSYRQSLRIIQNIKRKLRKEKYQFISISEFCDYSRLPVDEVLIALHRNKEDNGQNKL
jgi:hypothetical protein